MDVAYRDLTTLADCRQVLALEREVWRLADDELVPASLLHVSARCGAIIIGAFQGTAMVGFVYSFPGERHGRRLQWSHMLGVVPDWRGSGVGRRLKLLQRERALSQDLALVEWTYDPLQVANAHFNIDRLGAIACEYVDDAYGETQSPLHRGAPTDRLVAQWWLRSARVVARSPGGGPQDASTPVWQERFDDARVIALNRLVPHHGRYRSETATAFDASATVVSVSIPPDFTGLLASAPDLAREWRLDTRRLFHDAFDRGFTVVAFEPDQTTGGGRYLLSAGGP